MSKHADDGSWVPGVAGAMGVVDPLVEMSRTVMHAASSLGKITAYRSKLSLIRLARRIDSRLLGGR